MGMAKLRGGAAWVVAAAILAGCGASEPPPQAGTPASAPAADPAPAAVPAPAPAPVLVEGAGSIEVAETALRAQRLFTPAGNNAFELFLLAMERDPGSQRVKDALTDLFPYAVLHVEQRTAARDADEARRVLDLMTRAQPTAPALERLDRELERLERRLATEAAQQQAAAARAAAPPPAPTPTPAPAAAQTPAPAPTPAPQQPAASAPVQQQAPPPAAQPVATPPPAAAPASAPTPAPAPARAPRVVRQPPLRYPDQAMRQGIEGSVTLDFQINTDGSVSDVRVLDASPQGVFEREAMSVVRRTRFEPPAEPTRARRTIEFNLNQ